MKKVAHVLYIYLLLSSHSRSTIKKMAAMNNTSLNKTNVHSFCKKYVSTLSMGKAFFSNCYLAAPLPTLGHSQENSLPNPLLITAFYLFRLESHQASCNEVGTLSPAEHLVGFEPGTNLILITLP